MIKRFLCAAVALVLTVSCLPGCFGRLLGGAELPPSPAVLPESTLTVAETEIPADDIDPAWVSATASYITLEGDRVSVRGGGVSVSDDGRTLTVRQKGTYVFSGELYDGQIVVDVAQGRVHLVLAGASIHCETSSPIYVRQASTVRVIAEAGTVNHLSDGESYEFLDPVAMEPDAVLFSEDDLILCGTGVLQIEGNFRDAIHGKDRVTVADLALTVTAKEDGLVARDALLLRGATVTADCGRDCLKANNPVAGLGYVYAESGTYDLTSGTDAIQAAGRMLITGGQYHLLCGGGYAYPRELESRKGLKATAELVVTGGSFEIDSSDDAMHADERMAITGGSFSLYAGDDAILATALHIGGGEITVRTCLEGMVAEVMEIASGEISITSQMDGVNARIRALLTDEGFDLYPDNGGQAPSTAELHITGGTLVVNADRDAVCVRGTMQMSGGLVLLAGPELTGGDPLDCDRGFTMTGGTLVAVGRTTYLPALTAQSTVSAVEATFATVQAADSPVAVRSGSETLLTAISPRSFYKLAIFSSTFVNGSAYTLCSGGEVPAEEERRIFVGEGLSGLRAVGNFVLRDGWATLAEGDKLFPDDYYDEEIQ